MNTLVFDPIGFAVPATLAILYLWRAGQSLGARTTLIFCIGTLITSVGTFCGPTGVHVMPGAIILSAALIIERGNQGQRLFPAAAVYSLTFLSMIPIDLYKGYSCPSSDHIGRVGGGQFTDALFLQPLILALIHTITYTACDWFDRKYIDLIATQKHHFRLTNGSTARKSRSSINEKTIG